MAEEATMSEVATQAPTPPIGSKRKSIASASETKKLSKRAAAGDQSCLLEVRALLADGDRGNAYREALGSSAYWFRRSIIRKAAGENLLAREAIDQKLDSIRSELGGPNPTPMERLLAER